MVVKAATKGATKVKPKPPKKLTKAEQAKLKNKLKREAAAREKARKAELEKKSDRKPLQKNIRFKKDYDTDIGKENPFDRQVASRNVGTEYQSKQYRFKTAQPFNQVTPIRVGKDSMPTMRDINRLDEAAVSRMKIKIGKIAEEGNPAERRQANLILKAIDKAEAAKKADIDRRIGTSQAGKKPDQAGKYINKVTGEEVTLKGASGISAKERFLPMDYKGAKKADFIRNPTKGQVDQIERSLETKKRLDKQGESPEKDAQRAKEKARKKKLEKVVKTTEDPKFKRLDISKGLTEAQKKALRKKQGGMAMKKKGMAKGGMKKKGYAMGGMKKKGMAMGGLKKPAANQTGLQKLPTPVRNKMGYMKKGGMKKKGYAMGGMKKKSYAAGGMTVTYKVGGMAKGKMYGMVDNKKKK